MMNNLLPTELNREDQRLETFDHWPLSFIDKNILAKTGCYYLGKDDLVCCAFCDIKIKSWVLDDDPVVEHLKWSKYCPLLNRRLTKNIPIDFDELQAVLPEISYDVCGSGKEEEIFEIRPGIPEDSISSAALLSSNGMLHLIINYDENYIFFSVFTVYR